MQLACESGDIDAAIAEFKAAFPLERLEHEIGMLALASLIERHERHHRRVKGLRRALVRLTAEKINSEVAA